jgi:hypothetical protein
VEKNRPATFKYPLWSFISDYKMMWYMITGRMGREVEPGADGSRHERTGEHTTQNSCGALSVSASPEQEDTRKQQEEGQGEELARVEPCHAEPQLLAVHLRRAVRDEGMGPLQHPDDARDLRCHAGDQRSPPPVARHTAS